MTDAELTEMLRSSANRVVNYAGDRIEALTAERDHAWAMVANADTQMGQSLADYLQAKADNTRLREALEQIEIACEEEIRARTAGMSEAALGKSRILPLLQVPRNIARAALK